MFTYSFQVILRLPRLKVLDGVPVREEEMRKAQVACHHETVTLDLMFTNECLIFKMVSRAFVFVLNLGKYITVHQRINVSLIIFSCKRRLSSDLFIACILLLLSLQ